jgi:phenylalanyl-tRNA synthetase beta chain
LHPGKSAEIYIDNKPIGFIGCLHPDTNEMLDIKENIYICELFLEKIVEAACKKTPKYEPFSIYPFVYKDISIVVSKNIFAKDIEKFILSYNHLISDCIVFDRFEDEKLWADKISLGFRIYFSHREKTLTDDEVNLILNNLINDIQKEFSAQLR